MVAASTATPASSSEEIKNELLQFAVACNGGRDGAMDVHGMIIRFGAGPEELHRLRKSIEALCDRCRHLNWVLARAESRMRRRLAVPAAVQASEAVAMDDINGGGPNDPAQFDSSAA